MHLIELGEKSFTCFAAERLLLARCVIFYCTITATAIGITGSLTSGLLWSRWQGKRSQHSRRMRNSQIYISGNRPIAAMPLAYPFASIKVARYSRLFNLYLSGNEYYRRRYQNCYGWPLKTRQVYLKGPFVNVSKITGLVNSEWSRITNLWLWRS